LAVFTFNARENWQYVLTVHSGDSHPGLRGTLGYREHFLRVPRDVEI